MTSADAATDADEPSPDGTERSASTDGETTDAGSVVAFVGATGGAGTTWTTLSAATLLAREGHAVAVVDAAFATQGLADHLAGRLDPDLTALLTDEADAPLSAGAVTYDADVPGRVACWPASAPFERVARAKTPGAARRLESRIADAADEFDAVLLDVPPVAANQAVAAVNAADETAVVTPATDRGADAAARMHDVLADVGAAADVVVATRGELDVADVSVPTTADGPAACATDAGEYVDAVAACVAAVLGDDVAADAESGFLSTVGRYVSR